MQKQSKCKKRYVICLYFGMYSVARATSHIRALSIHGKKVFFGHIERSSD